MRRGLLQQTRANTAQTKKNGAGGGKILPLGPGDTREASAQPEKREKLITRLIVSTTEELHKVLTEITTNQNLSQEIVRSLYEKFHLRLLGVTKRLEFLMDANSRDVEKVLGEQAEVQQVLARVVPQETRQQVTWSGFSRQPLQCEEDLSRQKSTGQLVSEGPNAHADEESDNVLRSWSSLGTEGNGTQDETSNTPLANTEPGDNETPISDQTSSTTKHGRSEKRHHLISVGDEDDSRKDGIRDLYVRDTSATFGNQFASDSQRKDVRQTSFIEACCSGDVNAVRNFILDKIDVNSTNSDGFTALHLSAQYGHTDVCLYLLRNGALLEAQGGRYSWTPLHKACFYNRAEVADCLIQHKADVNAEDQAQWTPLHLAAQNGHTKVISCLLGNKADINVISANGDTPLLLASQNDHLEAVKVLLKHKADVNVANKMGCTALYKASQNGHLDIAKELVQSGAEVDIKTNKGPTPLLVSCQKRHTDAAVYFMERGADVNVSDREGVPALYYCCKSGQEELAEHLLQKGANPNMATKDGWTPLHLACRKGRNNVVKLLLGHKADLNVQSNLGHTPLHFACCTGNVETVKTLLDHKTDLTTLDTELGFTALHWASHGGHKEVVKVLLDDQADVATKEKKGFTPLHLACAQGSVDVVNLLLENGAGPNIQSDDGSTPLHAACLSGYREVVKSLLDHSADVNITTQAGSTALQVARENGNTEAEKALVEKEAENRQ